MDKTLLKAYIRTIVEEEVKRIQGEVMNEPTGDLRVDAALELLKGISELDAKTQIVNFEELHRTLSAILSEDSSS